MSRLIDRHEDLTGERFYRLTVIECCGSRTYSGRKARVWKCKCDCGRETVVIGKHLKNGNTKSCGCLRAEKLAERSTKHGGVHDRLYEVWKSMKKRCNNKGEKCYSGYGGRGIKVCDEWSNYVNFRKWALNNGYDETAEYGECTLDRIDVDGNYEPSNCRFITLKEQSINRRDNRWITYKGKRYTLTQLAEYSGLKTPTLYMRLKNGWSVDDAVEKPVGFSRRKERRDSC